MCKFSHMFVWCDKDSNLEMCFPHFDNGWTYFLGPTSASSSTVEHNFHPNTYSFNGCLSTWSGGILCNTRSNTSPEKGLSGLIYRRRGCCNIAKGSRLTHWQFFWIPPSPHAQYEHTVLRIVRSLDHIGRSGLMCRFHWRLVRSPMNLRQNPLSWMKMAWWKSSSTSHIQIKFCFLVMSFRALVRHYCNNQIIVLLRVLLPKMGWLNMRYSAILLDFAFKKLAETTAWGPRLRLSSWVRYLPS